MRQLLSCCVWIYPNVCVYWCFFMWDLSIFDKYMLLICYWLWVYCSFLSVVCDFCVIIQFPLKLSLVDISRKFWMYNISRSNWKMIISESKRHFCYPELLIVEEDVTLQLCWWNYFCGKWTLRWIHHMSHCSNSTLLFRLLFEALQLLEWRLLQEKVSCTV